MKKRHLSAKMLRFFLAILILMLGGQASAALTKEQKLAVLPANELLLLDAPYVHGDRVSAQSVRDIVSNSILPTITKLESTFAKDIPAVSVSDGGNIPDTLYVRNASGGLDIRVSNGNRPPLEDIYYVLGHFLVESVLGRPEVACYLNAANAPSGFNQDGYFYTHNQLDIYKTQSPECAFNEGWAQFFVSQTLLDRVPLKDQKFDFDLGNFNRAYDVRGRQLFEPVEVGFLNLARAVAELGTIGLDIFEYNKPELYAEIMAFLETKPCVADETHSCSSDSFGTGGMGVQGACEILANSGLSVHNVCGEFSNALQHDTTSSCMSFDKNWTTEPSDSHFIACNTKQKILCEDVTASTDNGGTLRLTTLPHELFLAETACLNEFGGHYAGIRSTTLGKRRAGALNLMSQGGIEIAGTGMAKNAGGKPRKIRKIDLQKQLLTRIKNFKSKVDEKTKDPAYNYLLVHALDIGAGSCHVAQCLGGESAIIDCGALGRSDGLDGDAVLTYMNEFGVFSQKPSVFISHGDWDHYRHIKKIMIGKKPRMIYFGGIPDAYSDGFTNWMNEHRRSGIKVNNRITVLGELAEEYRDMTLVDSFPSCSSDSNGANRPSLHYLAVNESARAPTNANTDKKRKTSVSKNMDSMAMMVRFHGSTDYRAVLPGDALGRTELRVTNNLSGFGSSSYTNTILMASHHGSDLHGSNSSDWLEFLDPTYEIYSAGDMFGHPNSEVIRLVNGKVAGQNVASHNIQAAASAGDPYRQYSSVRAHYSTRSTGNMVSIYAIPKPGTNKPFFHQFIKEEKP